MRAVGIIAVSAAWAALIAWWWLGEWTWPLTAACLVAAPLVAYVSYSWWPMLAPVGLWATVVGANAFWPTDGAVCACEPVAWGALLVFGMFAVAVIGCCYFVGRLLRQAVEPDRDRRGRGRLRLL